MAQTAKRPFDVDTFLEWEGRQEDRYEFLDGLILAMAGGTADHAAIVENVKSALREALRGRDGRVFGSDLKVVTDSLVAYPDGFVVRGPVDPKATSVRNPALIVEVLSAATADFDYGRKWRAYREISALRHYLLVDQDERRVELFSRTAAGWQQTAVEEGRVDMALLGLSLALDEIYRDTSLDAAAKA